MPRKLSRLSAETSPYLLAHANNPVDWFPWGEEAFEIARREDKPIFVSIGYSTCHWCHVMERESFEDSSIAAQLNRDFISIKVDREERPDVDEIYMSATVALSGSGGWPMSVFVTPEGEPFFAGTYFPPRDVQGRLGFSTLLSRIAEMWKGERKTLVEQAGELTRHVASTQRLAPAGAVSEDLIRAACRALSREFDPAFGGFGGAPKFPAPAALALLLRAHQRTGQNDLSTMVTRTLDGMLSGGMYDQLGGGFCRYSVDGAWLVPHFEKMLYDNAQLAELYTEAFQATGQGTYRRIARETLDYVLREMQSPTGGFFTASDADSEGQEGKYFVFTREEVRAALGEPHATRFCAFYGVTDEGNFEGRNVLSMRRDRKDVARELGIGEAELVTSLELGRARLLEARSLRVAPDVDDKILAAQSGLMMRALSNAARAFDEPNYLEAAERCAAFVLREGKEGEGLRRPDGGLFRTARAGRAHTDAYLEDYVFVADGLLCLYEVSGKVEYLRASADLCERALADFSDPESPALYFTTEGARTPVARPRGGSDSAMPNANAAMALLLGRLAVHLDRPAYRERAIAITRAFAAPMRRAPRAFCTMLCAVDFLLQAPLEIATTGAHDDERAVELRASLGSRFLPHRVECRLFGPGALGESALAQGRGDEAEPTAYVCEGSVCQKPVHTSAELVQSVDDALARHRKTRKTELGTQVIPGRATPEGTEAWTGKHPLAKIRSNKLDGLSVSAIGLGTHRIGLDTPVHEQAARAALLSGVNFVDTSPSFAFGDSERLVGQVLSALVEEGSISREGMVVITKIGVALGSSAEELEQRRKSPSPPQFTCPLGPLPAGGHTDEVSIESGAFSLDPSFVRAQITSSLTRLRLEHIDVCLVQSPEHLLAAGLDRTTFKQALTTTFSLLEEEVTQGRIGRYGVLTNTTTRSADDELFVSALTLVDWAEEVAGSEHHFRVVEMPINLVETAALERPVEDPNGSSLSERLAKRNVSVLATRPLSAFVDGALLRLAPTPPSQLADLDGALRAARYKVASLEAEFETTFAAQLRVTRKVGPEPVLPLSGALGKTLEQSRTREQFRLAESTLVTPQMKRLLGTLDRFFGGPGGGKWAKFREQYVQAVGSYLGVLHEVATQGSLDALAAVEVSLEGHPALAPVASEDWVERALLAVAGAPGVTSVLVGLRTPEHVRHALG